MGWGGSQGVSRSNQVACVCLCVCLRICVPACMCACMYVCLRVCVSACMCACMHPSRWTNTVSMHSSGVSTSESEPKEARTRVPVDMRSFFDSCHVRSVSHFPETGEDGSQFPFLLLPREKGQAFSSLSHFSISPSAEPAGWGRG